MMANKQDMELTKYGSEDWIEGRPRVVGTHVLEGHDGRPVVVFTHLMGTGNNHVEEICTGLHGVLLPEVDPKDVTWVEHFPDGLGSGILPGGVNGMAVVSFGGHSDIEGFYTPSWGRLVVSAERNHLAKLVVSNCSWPDDLGPSEAPLGNYEFAPTLWLNTCDRLREVYGALVHAEDISFPLTGQGMLTLQQTLRDARTLDSGRGMRDPNGRDGFEMVARNPDAGDKIQILYRSFMFLLSPDDAAMVLSALDKSVTKFKSEGYAFLETLPDKSYEARVRDRYAKMAQDLDYAPDAGPVGMLM